MAQDGMIDLSEVKAKYSIRDIILVDSREIDFANEQRFTSEVSSAIGLTLLGVVITEYNFELLITTIIFLGFSIFSGIRYFIKVREIKKYKEPMDKMVD